MTCAWVRVWIAPYRRRCHTFVSSFPHITCRYRHCNYALLYLLIKGRGNLPVRHNRSLKCFVVSHLMTTSEVSGLLELIFKVERKHTTVLRFEMGSLMRRWWAAHAIHAKPRLLSGSFMPQTRRSFSSLLTLQSQLQVQSPVRLSNGYSVGCSSVLRQRAVTNIGNAMLPCLEHCTAAFPTHRSPCLGSNIGEVRQPCGSSFPRPGTWTY
jgi:hypothetical protein